MFCIGGEIKTFINNNILVVLYKRVIKVNG